MATGPTVVITDSDLGSDADEQVLRAAGCTTVRLHATTESEIAAGVSAADPDALVVQWARVSAAVLDAAPRCRFVSRLGIGYDMIDVAAATERGVAVANTPDYCVDEVVSHTLAMALWLLRGLGRFDAAVRDAQWSATGPWPLACRPSAAAIGVVGLGRIGSRVARQATALGFEVLACDPYAEAPPGVPLLDLAELLRRSDLVTLHAPLTDETRHLIRAETIALMRPGGLLVNTCRGGLVDESALIKAMNDATHRGRRPRCFRDRAPARRQPAAHAAQRAAQPARGLVLADQSGRAAGAGGPPGGGLPGRAPGVVDPQPGLRPARPGALRRGR